MTMIDLRRLSQEAEYRRGAERKGATAQDIDILLAAESRRLDLMQTAESLRAESNKASKEIGQANPEDRADKIAAASELKQQLGQAEADLTAAADEVATLSLEVPNPAHESVPDGGEDDYRVETTVGDKPAPPKFSHSELGEHLGIVDSERAVRMSGSRFAYVKGDAVRLQFALVQWAISKATAHGFIPVIPPVLVREDMMELAGFFPTDRNQVYELEQDELFLIGTAEVGLAGLHRQERLDAAELPLRYAGYSSCFRREAGTYGKDTAGLFRVHQFDKVELFSYTTADKSWEELELIRQLQEEIVGGLELPYQLITVASGDLGAAAAKKYDIEVWLPSEQRYRELTSCSNYTDYSARRMSTRVVGETGTELAHTLNGTACAVGRTLLNIFENHQREDGTVVVPEVLRPFCGLEVLSAVK